MAVECAVLMMTSLAQGLATTDIQPLEGWVIFEPTPYDASHGDLPLDEMLARGLWDPYRYGPSIIVNADGSIDAWFASPGGAGPDGKHQWDWIRHRHSADQGKTWGPDTVVLKPTPDSRDRQSVCDPGVIRFGGFYYLGVTAVADPEGHGAEVFVARSQCPAGPFEKWDGKGWGGAPEPLVAFHGPEDAWGAGEPSFVKRGNTLFIYYTVWSRTEDGKHIVETHVDTAPTDRPDWPAHSTHRGVAFKRLKLEDSPDVDEDSADVKYIACCDTFVALAVAERLSPTSYLTLRESSDGISFGPPRRITANLKPKCHNMGVSGTVEGHIVPQAKNFIAYAFAAPEDQGANWHTFWQPVSVTVREQVDDI